MLRPDSTDEASAYGIVPTVGDYRMIDTIHIENFKCFRTVRLESLGRFNFAVGHSASGKTALLDALFLAAGARPDLFIRTQTWRGSRPQSEKFEISAESYESFFRELFHNFGLSSDPAALPQPALIDLHDSESGSWHLSVTMSHAQQQDSLPLASSSSETLPPLAFVFSSSTGNGQTLEVVISPQHENFVKATGKIDAYSMVYLNPNGGYDVAGNVGRFSEISKKNAEDTILLPVKKLFDDIDNISIQPHGGGNVLFVSQKHIARKLPLGSLSGGLSKFLSILLAIATRPKGVVLIDEIENGFYYAHLPQIMEAIVAAAESNQTQIFATTHSYELLEAVARASDGREDSVSLIHLERSQGVSSAIATSGRPAIEAIRLGQEVRR